MNHRPGTTALPEIPITGPENFTLTNSKLSILGTDYIGNDVGRIILSHLIAKGGDFVAYDSLRNVVTKSEEEVISLLRDHFGDLPLASVHYDHIDNDHVAFFVGGIRQGEVYFVHVFQNGCVSVSGTQRLRSTAIGQARMAGLPAHEPPVEEEEEEETPGPRDGDIFAIGKDLRGQMQIKLFSGKAGLVFREDHYAPDAVSAYRTLVKDLVSSTPSGRLAIFQGPPGTGKTSLLQCAVRDTSRACLFLIVPPQLVLSLTEPDALSAIAEFRRNNNDKRIVLLIEDANACLEERKEGNRDVVSHVSALLNLSDGILGKSLDLFVIATTNGHVSLDEAAVRKRRLTVKCEVGNLNFAQAGQLVRTMLASGQPSGPASPERHDGPLPEEIESQIAAWQASIKNASLGDAFAKAVELGYQEPIVKEEIKKPTPPVIDMEKLRSMIVAYVEQQGRSAEIDAMASVMATRMGCSACGEGCAECHPAAPRVQRADAE